MIIYNLKLSFFCCILTFLFSLFVVDKSSKPVPPENCTLVHQSHFFLRIKCQVPEKNREMHDTYVLQVFHADSRILIGTATSQFPDDIVFKNLPKKYDDLLLFVRTKDHKSIMSDASIIYVSKSSEIYGKKKNLQGFNGVVNNKKSYESFNIFFQISSFIVSGNTQK